VSKITLAGKTVAHIMTDRGTERLPPALSTAQRRRAWNMAYWNIGLWAIGNGLTSTTLVIYLALESSAPKLGISIGLIFLGNTLDYNHWIFLLGWAARCLGILALLLVVEPSNKSS
jgi:hypothetical protein